MKHAHLVEVARQWLKRTRRCSVVITELVTCAGEVPDAIGWTRGLTVVVECKTSRSDFFRDAEKYFRRAPERGMGDWRYFLTPAGLLKVADLPPGWGLLEVAPRGVVEIHPSHGAGCPCSEDGLRGYHSRPFMEKDHQNEAILLLSVVRRLQTGVWRGRATLDTTEEQMKLEESP